MTDAGHVPVVLATDGETPALQAEQLLTDLADRSRSTVLVACVNTFDLSLKATEDLHLDRYSADAGYRRAREIAETVVARLAAAGFETRWDVPEGDAPTELLDLVQEQSIELVVLGAGHARGREVPVLGRTSRVVLHEAPCPILLVRRCDPSRARGKVLVATDGSTEAEQAIRSFASFADPSRCEVLAVSVTRGPTPGAVDDMGPTPAGEHREEVAEAAVAGAAAILDERGFACKTEVVRGHPGRTLLELAEREGSSVVVAGSRGLGRLRRLALGSVSDTLARHADAAFIGRDASKAPPRVP